MGVQFRGPLFSHTPRSFGFSFFWRGFMDLRVQGARVFRVKGARVCRVEGL